MTKLAQKDFDAIGPLLARVPSFMTWNLWETDIPNSESRYGFRVEYKMGGMKAQACEFRPKPAEAIQAVLDILNGDAK